MGRKDSSSKTKRKRDKISSKKKSKRKDRKKRRICDSVDDLLNSEHSQSPTLKSDHRRKINKKRKGHRDSSYSDHASLSSDSDSDKSRKARRSEVGLKDKKRRGRKRSASPNGDVVRKRKRLDRDRIVKPIKKTSKKKKKHSKYSSSCSSSDSESHSICQSRSSGSTEDIERVRRSRGSRKAKKLHKVRTPNSSSDRDIEPSISISDNDEALFPTNNSRRLRSVIVVVSRSPDEVENKWEMDPHKEEIVHDQNDCPGALGDRIYAENVAVEEAPELQKSRIDIGDHQLEEGTQTNDSGKQKENDVFVPEEGEILESILRQKALERLKKFKERLQTGPRSTTVETSDVGTVDVDQNKLIEGSSNTQEINKTGALSSTGESSLTESKDSEQSFADPPKEVKTFVECSEEDKCVNASRSSTMKPSSSGEHGLERGNEAKDGSHFQQKTMSVMRGGEQVQVSYKVYIPQKAPALARRQLRR